MPMFLIAVDKWFLPYLQWQDIDGKKGLRETTLKTFLQLENRKPGT